MHGGCQPGPTSSGNDDRAGLAGNGNFGHELERGESGAVGRAKVVIAQQVREYLEQQRALSRLRSAVHEQGRRHYTREDRLRPSAGGESTLEPLLLSERRSPDVSSYETVAARTHQPGDDVPKNEVDFVDPIRPS